MGEGSEAMIRVERVGKWIQGMPILENIHFSVEKGEMFGIIGPNGSGKSTLLKLLSGVEQASSGQIWLNGRKIESYSRKQLARQVAVLQQESLPPVGFTVREVIEMGRYPFQNWLGKEGTDFTPLIDSIIQKLGLAPLEKRTLDCLSGGERQRVALGKVMAQQPALLLLDEPTTYLDIGFQIQMMDYIRTWQREGNLTVVAVLHDLNLAAQYCDRILILYRGKQIQVGTPQEIINASLLQRVYGVKPVVLKHPAKCVPQILL